MLKKSFNVKKILLGISASVVTVAAGIGVFQNVNNGKENNQVSFEQKLVAAAKQYVENNQIAVEKEIKTTAEYLENTGDFSREEDNQCANYSYVIVRNENGTYSYEPVLICENPEESKNLNLAIGYMMEQALDDIETPVKVLDYELSYSTTAATNGSVIVSFKTNFPARIVSTTGKIEDWTITSSANGENTVFTKTFTENGDEIVDIDDLGLNLGTPRTVKISVKNIDKKAPEVTGVENGKTYTENKTITFDEGTATLKKGDEEPQPFKSGDTVKEGNYVLVVTDEAGNKTTVNFTIDTTAPTITLTSGEKTNTSTGIDNTTLYYNEPVNVEVTDTTNIKSLTYSLNGGQEQPFTSPMTFDEVGTYVIRATDSSSETGFTSTKTFVYNTSKPVIKNVKHGGQYKQAMTVIVEDDLPVKATFTQNNGAAQNFEVTSHYDSTIGKYVTSTELSAEGRYVVSATDAAGNVLERPNTTFVIDWTAPTISGIEHNGYYGNSATVTITLNDNLTAVKDLTAILTKPDKTTETFVSGTTLENFTHGSYTLTVTDRAQNKVEYTFMVDTQNTVEVVSKEFDKTITKNPVDVTITFNKPVLATIVNPKGNVQSFVATNADELGYASTYVLTVTNAETVEFSFKDRLGLTGNDSVTVSNIDIVAPTFTGATTNPTGLTNGNTVTVTLNFSELVKITGSNAGDFTAVSPNGQGFATSYTYTATYTEENPKPEIVFDFVDQAELSGHGTYTVENFDKKAPVIVLRSGATVETISQTDLTKIYYFKGTVTVDYSDDREGLVTATYGNDSQLMSGEQLKEERTYTLVVTDEANNTTSVTFVIDKQVPDVTLSSSKTGTDNEVDVFGGDVTINVTEDSPFTIMSTFKNQTTEITANENGHYVIAASKEANGLYTITVTDKAGNTTSKTFRIDSQKPEVTLTSLATPFEYNNVTYYNKAVTFSVKDDTTTTIKATLNGEAYTLNGNTVSVSGLYVLTVTDAVGNETIKTFAIDSAAPTMTITSSANKVTDKNVTVYGGTVTVEVNDGTNGTPVTVKNGETELTPNADGKYVFDKDGLYVITATDRAGNSVSETFRIDTKAPVVEGAAHGKQYKDENLTVKVTDDSTYSASYTITNGETKEFTGEITLTKEGRYTLIASDVVGNKLQNSPGKEYITFIIDRTAPTITGAEDGAYYGKNDKNTPITFKDNLASASQITATITKPDKTRETFVSGTTLANYPDGTYTLTVKDKAGNTKTIKFTIDTTDPDVTPEIPDDITIENDAFTTRHEVVKDGTYTGVEMNVGEGVTLVSKVITNSDKEEVESIPLTKLGTYTIVYTYENRAHNQKVFTETVIVEDTTEPTVTITDKDGNDITGVELIRDGKTILAYNVPVKVTAEDILTPASDLTATYADGTAYILGTLLGENKTTNGEYTIVVRDGEGNANTITFVVDTLAPEIGGLTGGEKREDGKTYYKQKLTLSVTDLTTRYSLKNGETVKIKATYSYNGGEAVDFVNDSANLELDGTYTIFVEDILGNQYSETFELDATAPRVIKYEEVLDDPKSGNVTKGNVKVIVTFSENVTIKTSTITIGEATTNVSMTPVDGNKSVYEVIVTDNGTIQFTYEDASGQVGTAGEHEISNIDRNAPTMTFPNEITVKDNAFTTKKEVSSEGTYTGLEVDSITVKDDLAGVESVTKVIKNSQGETIDSINLTQIGTYTITYTATDKVTNARTVTETVVVADTTKPEITIDGNVSLIIVEKGKTVTYPNVTATDIYDGPVTVTDDRETVNTNVARDYTVTFTATDSSNNTATKTIKVRVLDLDKLRAEEARLADLASKVNDNVFEAVVENKNDYTESSWNEKQRLIKELNDLVNGEAKETTTQEFVNEKMDAIIASALVPTELNKSEYNKQMAAANKLVESDYTEASWANLQAKKDQDIKDITLQSGLNAVTKSIEQAIKDLQGIDFKDYVDSEIARLQRELATHLKTDYTSESYKAVEDKILEVRNSTIYYGGDIKAKSEFTKLVETIDIDSMLEKLPIDDTTLKALKKDLADNYNESDYTADSWKNIQDLIKEVDAIVANPDALRSQYKAAMDKIDLTTLVLIPKVDVESINLSSSSKTNYAKVGDTLTLTFTGNRTLTNVNVTINEKEAKVTKTDTGFIATVTVEDNDKEGKVSYTITPVGEETTPVTKQSDIIVDHTKPEVSVSASNPDGLNNWYIKNPTITLTATDANGIDYAKSKYTITVDGTEVATGSLTDGNVPLTTELSGVIVVSVEVYDNAGNKNTDSVTINKDATEPVITITDKDGNTVAGKEIDGKIFYKVPVKVTATDTYSNNVTALDNDSAYVLGELISDNTMHTVVVTDEAGNHKFVTFGIDTVAPEIEGLTGGETINGKTYYKQKLTLSLTDNSTSILGRPAVITATYSYNGGEAQTFTGGELTNDGTYVITVTDEVGNTKTVEFVLDATAPKLLKITRNPEGLTQQNVTVTFTFSENVTVKSATTTIKDATTNVEMNPVGDSKNVYTVTITDNGTIDFTVEDEAGHSLTYSYDVNDIDRIEPTITVTSDSEGKIVDDIVYYNKPVTVTATDNMSAVANLTATDNDNAYTLGTEITTNGTHTIKVTDQAGKEAIVTFVIDMLPPSISLENNSFHNREVSFTATDAETDIETVVAKHTPVVGDVTTITLTKNENGNYILSEDGVYEITVTDLAGNTTIRKTTIDSKPPVISVENNSFHKTDVEFTVADQTLKTVVITKDNEAITLTLVDGKYTATLEGVYQVTATDEAGLSTTRTFTIDKTGPKLKVDNTIITNKQIFGSNITFTTDDKTRVTVTAGENSPSITDNGNGTYTTTTDGIYVIQLLDQAGNEATVTFVVDSKDPITDLVGEKYYNETVNFTVTDTTNVTVKSKFTPAGSETATETTLTKGENGYSVSADGYYEITITDEAGHSISREFVIDSVAPKFNITNNSYHKGMDEEGNIVPVTVTIDDETTLDIAFDSTSINGGEANIEISADSYQVSGDGIYTFTATDAAGNTTTVTFTIDSKPPVIKNIEDGKSYKSGVIIEVEDPTLSTIELGSSIISNGSTVSGEGTYTVTATDLAGNVTTRTFTIDDQPPVVTLPSDITVENNAFTTRKEVASKGTYTGLDITTITANEAITVTKVMTTGDKTVEAIDLTKLATSTIVYTIADGAGNSVVITETVIVEDTTKPEITIDGNVSLIIVEKGKTITYPNVTATDIYDGPVTVTDDRETVNTNVARDYTVTFTATDSSNNTATKTIKVRVLDLDKLRAEEARLADLASKVNDNVFEAVVENKNDYTENSWNEKQRLIKELNDLVNGAAKETTTQEFVNEKMDAIIASVLVPTELNKSEYNKQMAAANQLVESDYTEASWANLQAKKDQDIKDITLQSGLNAVTKSIEQAIKDLQKIDFKDYVDSEIARLQRELATHLKTDYTSESYKAVEDKILEVRNSTIYYGGNIDVKSEFTKLVETIDIDSMLEKLPIDDTTLKVLKKDLADNYNESDYTTSSWKNIQDLIKEVDAIVANPDALRSQYKAAMDKIDLTTLVLIPKVDVESINLSSSSKTNYAKVGDTLTLTFTGNRTLTNVNVTINEKEAKVTKTDTGFIATVTVEDNDKEGKVSYTITPVGEETTPVTKQSDIIVDRTKPEVSVSASNPDGLNNWYIKNPTITLTATDANGIDYAKSKYTITVDGTEVATGTLTDGNVPLTTELSGVIVVSVEVYDNAGNKNTDSVTINKDAVNPTVTVTGVSDKKYEFNGIGEIPTYYFNEEVKITATDNVTKENYPTILLNGLAYVEGSIFKTNLERNEIVVTDEAGNTTTIYVVIDTEAPEVIFNNKQNTAEATGKEYTENEGKVTYYKEDLTLVIQDNVDKTLDITAKFTNLDGEESDITLTTDETTGISSALLDQEGTYVVSATDDAGFTTRKVIVIDKTAPTIEGVKSGGHYNHDVTITFTERNLDTAVLKADGVKTPENITSGKVVTRDVENGYNVTVTDKAGHSVNISFRIDTTAPKVTLTTVEKDPVSQVVDNTKTWYYKTPVSISYDDGLRYQQITATYTFVSDTDEAKNFENKALANNTEVSEDGTYTINIKDKAGNTDTITFVVDRTVPIINKPLDNGVYGAGVEIDITEGTAKIDGVDFEKGEDGKFPKYAVEGTHTLVVTDAAGNEARVTFTIDTQAPVISGIPAKGINTSALEINVKDATKTTVTIDGEIKINKEMLPKEGKVILYGKDGKHKLVAVDEVGNTTEIEFVIDTKAPEITGLGEPYTTETNGSIVTKYYKEAQTLTFNDATLDYVQVNGTTVTLQDMKYTFDKDGLYEVVASDQAGHTTTERFVIDTKDPKITGVENNKHYKVRPTINATDDNLASVTLENGISIDSEYAEGEHTVTATDKLGHTTSIKFVYDVTPPTITIVDGDKTYTEHTTITVEANGGSYNIPTATATDTLSGTRTVKTEGTVNLSQLGEQTITYKATDEAGNETTVILTVNVVDNEAPTDLKITILNDSTDLINGWYIKPLKVKLSATDNGTGISEYQYRILSNGTPVTEWVTLKDFAEPTFTMPENISGSKITFEVKVFDAAKNFITKISEEFKVDQDAPSVKASVNKNANANGWYNENIDVLLEGSDATSNITHFLYQISLGNDIWTETARINATDNQATLTLKNESKTIFYRVIAVDEAGHQSVVKENEKAFKLDTTAPIITVDGKAYTETTTVTVKAEADKNKTYDIPTSTVTDNLDETVTVNQTGTVDLKTLGNQDIVYTATDEAGNTTTITVTVAVDDTTAPVITLNGNETEELSYGSVYQDKGATATDNLDETVTVTASYNVDPYQIKSYTVTYTAVDKKGNKSTKTRTVTVKSISTSQAIKEKSDCKESGTCYVETITDENGNDKTANYIWYSGRLWRAYIVNQDNTIKLVTEESMSGFAYNDGTSYKFAGSYAEDWLNGTFYNSLKNAPKIVVPTTYCNARITAVTNARETCSSKYQVANKNVALLTMDEYNLLGGARSFLYTGDAFYTMSGSSATDLVVIVENGTVEFGYKGHEPYAMRPVITISSDINIVSGKGTMDDPYYIQNNEVAASGANLNERNVGEYVQFGKNGQVWRIMETDGTATRLITDSFYKNGSDYVRMEYGDPKTFSTTAGIGQYLNTTVYNDLFGDKEKQAMLLTKWYYNGHKLGDNPKNTTLLASSTYTYAYVGLASVGEMMTGQSITGKVKGLSSWSINPNSQYAGKSWYFTSVGGADYYDTAGHTRGIRPVIELNPNVKIKGGNGTSTSPYILEY